MANIHEGQTQLAKPVAMETTTGHKFLEKALKCHDLQAPYAQKLRKIRPRRKFTLKIIPTGTRDPVTILFATANKKTKFPLRSLPALPSSRTRGSPPPQFYQALSHSVTEDPPPSFLTYFQTLYSKRQDKIFKIWNL